MLRNALLKLLNRKSIDEITIKELCESADINRSTFYAHYGNVRDVMLEIEIEIKDDVKNICDNKSLSLSARLEKICEYLYQKKDIELILFKNNTDGDLDDVFNKLNTEFSTSRNLSSSTPDYELILSFINYGMFNLIKTWLIKDIDKTPKQISELLINRLLKIDFPLM